MTSPPFHPALGLIALACSIVACGNNDKAVSNSAELGASGSAGVSFVSVPDSSFIAAPTECDAAVEATVPTATCVPSIPNVSYRKDVAPILSGCTGELCHGPWTRENTVGVAATECCDGRRLIAIGHADESYLVQKIDGAHALCAGFSMPINSTLNATIIRSWVCAGAPDN